MFSIMIPTYNNLSYLQLCLKSIKKNSYKNHEIIIHVNDGSDGTLDFVKKKKLNTLIQKIISVYVPVLIERPELVNVTTYYTPTTICIFVLIGISI